LPPEEARDSRLVKRVLTALPLIALMVICYNLGTIAFFILAATVVMIAAFELFDALGRSGRRPIMAFGLACVFAMLIAA
jgi:CDP-diglyceride synthetase